MLRVCDLIRWREDDVAKKHMPLFTALKVYGARLVFVAVERATGNARDLLMIDNHLAVLYDCDVAAEHRDVESLPDVGTPRLFRFGLKEAVYAAGMMAWRFALG